MSTANLGTEALGTTGEKVNDFRPQVTRRLWLNSM